MYFETQAPYGRDFRCTPTLRLYNRFAFKLVTRNSQLKFYLIKFLIPSISNPKDKRNVWSSGFDCAVEIR